MACSLKDIAADLNLSITTVSWVLSGNGDKRNISEVTQNLVKKRAEEMHYEPNLVAKSLSEGSTNVIGLIIPSISDLFYAQVAKAIEMEAEKSGYTIIFCSSESDPKRETNLIRTLRQRRVDGIIIAPTKKSDIQIKKMLFEKYPLVLFDRYYEDIKVNYVIVNNEESSYQIVDNLIKEEGKKKIAIITTNSYLLLMKDRFKGYKKALENNGLTYDKKLFVEARVSDYENELKGLLHKLFLEHDDIDGFFFTTHILAMETLKYLSSRFKDINTRFGFACIHETPLIRAVAPNMKIAKMPVDEIGKMASTILINEINNVKNKIYKSEKIQVKLQCSIK